MAHPQSGVLTQQRDRALLARTRGLVDLVNGYSDTTIVTGLAQMRLEEGHKVVTKNDLIVMWEKEGLTRRRARGGVVGLRTRFCRRGQ